MEDTLADRVIQFRRGKEMQSVIGRQIEATLSAGMSLPDPLEQLFRWIEAHGYFVDANGRRIGDLFPEQPEEASEPPG